MTVSIRRMSVGSGYQTLLRSVVAGDGNRPLSTPLTRYYHEVGTPPGRWMGSGLAAFGEGQLRSGMGVSEAQLAPSGEQLLRMSSHLPADAQHIGVTPLTAAGLEAVSALRPNNLVQRLIAWLLLAGTLGAAVLLFFLGR